MAAPSPLADACEGHFPGDFPAVEPHVVRDHGDGSLTAYYRCPCGRAWTCGWDSRSAGWPLSRSEAAA